MKALFRLPTAAAVYDNPSAEELQQMTAKMPNARWTQFGNLNVQTRVVSRSTALDLRGQRRGRSGIPRWISSEDAAEWIDRQDDYIAEQEMIVIDGYIGAQPEFRTPARLFIEAANANIAGMQQQLFFPVEDPSAFEPELTVIYTPNLEAPGYPDDRLIAVDLEHGVTRVFNSDYFGESKKGGCGCGTSWSTTAAACRCTPAARSSRPTRGDRVGLIVGLSGTGKTTTTFTRQNGSLPVQDDFVAWMPDGARLRDRERLLRQDVRAQSRRRADDPRRRHAARLVPRERLAARRRGRLLRHDLHAERPRDVPVRGDRVGRDAADRRGALPADPEPQREHHPGRREARRAAGSGLLHARRDDGHERRRRGRGGQVPARAGHEPVLPDAARPAGQPLPGAAGRASARGLPHEHRPRRRAARRDERSKKVRIPHSSAIVKGIAEGTIEWERDPDFGYRSLRRVPGIDAEDLDVLQPRRLYEAQGRLDEYERAGRALQGRARASSCASSRASRTRSSPRSASPRQAPIPPKGMMRGWPLPPSSSRSKGCTAPVRLHRRAVPELARRRRGNGEPRDRAGVRRYPADIAVDDLVGAVEAPATARTSRRRRTDNGPPHFGCG